MILEIAGYIGSALVVISMLMSSIVKLRVINTIGSIISCVYAIICKAYPLALMNICLIIINLYNLNRLRHQTGHYTYSLVETESDNSLVRYFLEHYKADILTYFPDFSSSEGSKKAYVVCCEGKTVGLLLGEEKNGTFDICVDYSTPAYRDCSVGKYLYGKLPERGIKTLCFNRKVSEGHKGYLDKMGYKQQNGAYVLNIG